MKLRAKEGALLDRFVRMMVRQFRQAEVESPHSGPGRKPEVPDWVLGVMIATGALLRKKRKTAQWRWWREHRAEFAHWMSPERLPGRSQFFDRYGRVERLFQQVIQQLSQHAIRRQWAQVRCVAVDKSLLKGRGRKWSARQRRQGKMPRGVDCDTTWGFSKHHGWVQGYAYEVVVSAPKQGICWPVLASVDTASRNEQRCFAEKTTQLPKTTRYVLADAGYDSNDLAEAIEGTGLGKRKPRRFLCPAVLRGKAGRKRGPHSRETILRQQRRRRREGRIRFFKSTFARRLYARRKTTVERFHSHFKPLFELAQSVWQWGLANNRIAILAAMTAYQILLTYNHRRRQPTAHLQPLLDAL